MECSKCGNGYSITGVVNVFGIAVARKRLCLDCLSGAGVEKDQKDHQIAELKKENRLLEELSNAAIDYINETPCDPDIYHIQELAWERYQKALSEAKSHGLTNDNREV